MVRYELGGIPLPYASTTPLYRRLFPNAPTTITKAADDAEDDLDLESYYDPSSIPTCKRCGGKRVFELQLIPHLISILPPDALTTTGSSNCAGKRDAVKVNEEERKKELARIAAGLEGGAGEGVGEMEWGSIFVFGCESDCVGFGEEWVEVEWESTLGS